MSGAEVPPEALILVDYKKEAAAGTSVTCHLQPALPQDPQTLLRSKGQLSGKPVFPSCLSRDVDHTSERKALCECHLALVFPGPHIPGRCCGIGQEA